MSTGFGDGKISRGRLLPSPPSSFRALPNTTTLLHRMDSRPTIFCSSRRSRISKSALFRVVEREGRRVSGRAASARRITETDGNERRNARERPNPGARRLRSARRRLCDEPAVCPPPRDEEGNLTYLPGCARTDTCRALPVCRSDPSPRASRATPPRPPRYSRVSGHSAQALRRKPSRQMRRMGADLGRRLRRSTDLHLETQARHRRCLRPRRARALDASRGVF